MDTAPTIPESLMNEMLSYDWPGNVRELQNVILRYLATGQAQFISPVREAPGTSPREKTVPPENETLEQALARAERDCILRALQRCRGNKSRAAEELGVNLRTFHRRCSKLGIVRQLDLSDSSPQPGPETQEPA